MVFGLGSRVMEEPEYLRGLNPSQREAVTWGEGPLLILAGAGSGKTRVLASRAAFLVHQGKARPYQILAITFTNKAAGELKRRTAAMVGAEGDLVVAGTFHSIFARILRIEGRGIDVNPQFTILDEEDRSRLIKHILKDFQVEMIFNGPQEVVGFISRAKNELKGIQHYNDLQNDEKVYWKVKIWEEYERRKQQMVALDFDDLLVVPARAFDRFPAFLERCRERFRWVLVDEFQDTNYVQNYLIQRICAEHRNLNVVGDDDQAIYGWRGATVANILNFTHDWPDAKVIRLEQNYRSPKIILDVAWSVVSRNPNRHLKKLWTDRLDNPPVYLVEAENEDDEARLFATLIQQMMATKGYSYHDFAILYRTNAQSLPFERTLRALSIPYQVVGGLRFYERKEVKDLLAYLRLVVNPNDDVAFLRVVNYPPRGIGDKVLAAVMTRARERGISLYQAGRELSRLENDLPPRQRALLREFYQIIERLAQSISQIGLLASVSELVETIGLKDRLKEEEREDPTKAESKLANLYVLIDEIARYESDDTEGRGLVGFLEQVSLVTEVDRYDQNQPRVSLLTIHSAKGLEFPVVFLGGLEEGILPLLAYRGADADIEEERRLFYVGATRAMNHLILGYARERLRWGDYGFWRGPSRFLREIPQHLLTPWNFPSLRRLESTIATNLSPSSNEVTIPGNWEVSTPRSHLSLDQLKKGLKVKHPKFGIGTIVGLRVNGLDTRIEVEFYQVGLKVLVFRYAPLEIVTE